MTSVAPGELPALSTVTPDAPVGASRTRPGLDVTMAEPLPGGPPTASPVWAMGPWTIQFVRLGPRQRIGLDRDGHATFAKVVTGSLVGLHDSAFPPPRQARDTLVTADHLEAGDEGALVAVLTDRGGGDEPVTSMEQLRFRGPHEEVLAWERFEERFAGRTAAFDGADASIAPGFHLLDGDGSEIAYVHVWTAGKGEDLTTHDHGHRPSPTAPPFAEVHWVFSNGTGEGGMYECEAPGAVKRRLPLHRGQEHGPYFARDDVSGRPRRRENGAVEYVWHGWEAGPDDGGPQAYDVVAAFEIDPDRA